MSINITEDGINTLLNEEHFWNAFSPIVLTDEGIDILHREEQPWNAFSPMEVIEEEIIISVKDVQLENILFGIVWIVPVISRVLTPSNVFLPNDVTDEGIDINDNE